MLNRAYTRTHTHILAHFHGETTHYMPRRPFLPSLSIFSLSLRRKNSNSRYIPKVIINVMCLKMILDILVESWKNVDFLHMLESGLVTNFYHICIISKCVTFEVTFFLNINLVIPVLSEKNHFASNISANKNKIKMNNYKIKNSFVSPERLKTWANITGINLMLLF